MYPSRTRSLSRIHLSAQISGGELTLKRVRVYGGVESKAWNNMPELKGLLVLIVEDELFIADLVQEMLIDLGCVPIGPATT